MAEMTVCWTRHNFTTDGAKLIHSVTECYQLSGAYKCAAKKERKVNIDIIQIKKWGIQMCWKK